MFLSASFSKTTTKLGEKLPCVDDQQSAITGFPDAQFDSFAALEDEFSPRLANREGFHVFVAIGLGLHDCGHSGEPATFFGMSILE
jgi:hypothetical protein